MEIKKKIYIVLGTPETVHSVFTLTLLSTLLHKVMTQTYCCDGISVPQAVTVSCADIIISSVPWPLISNSRFLLFMISNQITQI
jgi:hypothetical protein